LIDYKWLIGSRDHLKSHSQMLQDIIRLMRNSIDLFDGQHKVAALILNGAPEVDVVRKEGYRDDTFLCVDEPQSGSAIQTPPSTFFHIHAHCTVLHHLSRVMRRIRYRRPAAEYSEAAFVRFFTIVKD
jgi:hypothetical protein